MLSDFQVQLVKPNEELRVKVENLGVFFVLTPSDDILDAQGRIRDKLFFIIVRHTYKDFFLSVARRYPDSPFDVVTYHEPSLGPQLNSHQMASMTTQLVQNLWADGHLNGKSLVISMGSIRNKETGAGHNILVGFTFRSDQNTIFLMEGENSVRGI